MSTETLPIADTIRRHAKNLHHFHANDPNRRGPGFGEVLFSPIFQALADIRYERWISVEVFDYTPDPVTIARQSIEYMQQCASHVIYPSTS
jgi:sugar phosphate isomerase/epimerase